MVRQLVRPLLSISLIGGATLNIWNEYLEAGGPVVFLRDLTNAGLVTMPNGHGGQVERPAIGVWNRRGRYAFFVPADPDDATRAVEAIYAARPDLRAQGIPRGVVVRGPRDGGRNVAGIGDTNERALAAIAHISVLFFPLLLPLVLWAACAQASPYASRQARQAFLFHLCILILDAVIIVLLVAASAGSLIGALTSGSLGGLGISVLALLVGALAVIGLSLFGIGYSLFAAIEAMRGRPFSYPLLRRL